MRRSFVSVQTGLLACGTKQSRLGESSEHCLRPDGHSQADARVGAGERGLF